MTQVFTATALTALLIAAAPATAQQVAAAATDQATQVLADATTDGTPSAIVSAEGLSLDQFLWLKRPVVVFADSPADPRFEQQMAFITERLDVLVERDVVVITDTDPATPSAVRRTLRPRGFMLAVLAKDGSVVTRKPRPWDVREISRSIDKLPLRQQELRDGRSVD